MFLCVLVRFCAFLFAFFLSFFLAIKGTYRYWLENWNDLLNTGESGRVLHERKNGGMMTDIRTRSCNSMRKWWWWSSLCRLSSPLFTSCGLTCRGEICSCIEPSSMDFLPSSRLKKKSSRLAYNNVSKSNKKLHGLFHDLWDSKKSSRFAITCSTSTFSFSYVQHHATSSWPVSFMRNGGTLWSDWPLHAECFQSIMNG